MGIIGGVANIHVSHPRRENQIRIWQAMASSRSLAASGPKWNNDKGHGA